jgi:hypothetical protein
MGGALCCRGGDYTPIRVSSFGGTERHIGHETGEAVRAGGSEDRRRGADSDLDGADVDRGVLAGPDSGERERSPALAEAIFDSSSIVSVSLVIGAPIPVSSEKVVSEAEKLFVITPRREQDLYESVVETPVGEHAHKYKYYCPLCMEYYKDLFKTSCCGNYCCVLCITQYLQTKGINGATTSELLGNLILNNERRIDEEEVDYRGRKVAKCVCPHCFTAGFQMALVLTHEDVRDYSRGTNALGRIATADRLPAVSPVRIGDTYENLKRKMVPYQASGKTGEGTGNVRSHSPQPGAETRDSAAASGPPMPEYVAVAPASASLYNVFSATNSSHDLANNSGRSDYSTGIVLTVPLSSSEHYEVVRTYSPVSSPIRSQRAADEPASVGEAGESLPVANLMDRFNREVGVASVEEQTLITADNRAGVAASVFVVRVMDAAMQSIAQD